MISKKPFYNTETYHSYELDFESRMNIFNRTSPFLVRNFIKSEIKPKTSNISNSNLIGEKFHKTENNDDYLQTKQLKILETMKIRPISMNLRKSLPENTLNLNTNINNNDNATKKQERTLKQPYLTPKNASISSSRLNDFYQENSMELFTKIKHKTKMNLHNVDYLKCFNFAYDNNMGNSVTLGLLSSSFRSASKHLKPDLYLKFFKTRSQKCFPQKFQIDSQNKTEMKNLKTPNFQKKKSPKKNFFVTLSGDSDHKEKVPIIHTSSNKVKSLFEDQQKMISRKQILNNPLKERHLSKKSKISQKKTL